MKRFYIALAGLTLGLLSATGCRHTAGACDCDPGHHPVVHPGGHPVLGAYGNQPMYHSSAPTVVASPGGEKIEKMPKVTEK